MKKQFYWVLYEIQHRVKTWTVSGMLLFYQINKDLLWKTL